MPVNHVNHAVHFNLIAAAHEAMVENGFHPDFPAGTDAELAALAAQPATNGHVKGLEDGFQDLRNLLWSSIDNDTSKDLDQIEWAEQLPDGRIRVLVGVADVDARVAKGTLLDKHAQSETTSVYTGVKVFPMLPPQLSEGITSLNENEDRAAMVIEVCVDAGGTASDGKAYRALVRNRAQLAYGSVGAWLEGHGPAPAKVAANAELAAQLKLQDAAAQRMEGCRLQHGALDLETIETRPVMPGDQPTEIAQFVKNRATSLIEEFMVAANGVVARTLQDAGVASIRRIVRTPKRWDRIVELAAGLGTKLPADARLQGAERFSAGPKAEGPGPLSRSLAGGGQADGPGRVCADQAQRALAGTFRPGRAGLYPLHGSQPPLSRRGDAADLESLARRLSHSPTPKTCSMPSRSTARRWKTRRARWSGRCRSGLRRWCCSRGSARASRPW